MAGPHYHGDPNSRLLDVSKVDSRMVPRSWMRGRVAKDISQTDIAWLHDIADKSEPKVRAAFIAAVKTVQAGVDDKALEAAVQNRDVAAVMRVLNLDTTLQDALGKDFQQSLEDVFIDLMGRSRDNFQ